VEHDLDQPDVLFITPHADPQQTDPKNDPVFGQRASCSATPKKFKTMFAMTH
jgi:hypothetical protein